MSDKSQMSTIRFALELIGAFSVVASLVFVGIQIRQGAEATKAATVLDLKQSWVDLNLSLSSNPKLSRIWSKMQSEGFDSLERQEQGLVFAHFRAITHIWSNAYYQYRVGTLDEEQWTPLVRDIDDLTQHPAFWKTWEGWDIIFDDAFRDLINQRRPTGESPSLAVPQIEAEPRAHE